MWITWYEQLVADRKGETERIAAFLGKEISKEEVEKVSNFLQVDSYRAACQLGNRQERIVLRLNDQPFLGTTGTQERDTLSEKVWSGIR